MSELTPRLALPLIAASQAQKHIPVNEALSRLDALVQLSVIGRDLTVPPSAPADGARYIVASDASGAWLGKDRSVAAYDAGWIFVEPADGWLAWDSGAQELLVFTEGEWAVFSSGGEGGGDSSDELQNIALLGIGGAADSSNPFLAKLNTALWAARETGDGGTGDLRYVMNKEASANVLSLLLQSGYSGRAEIGLVGDDDLLFKVSSDGTTWREALRINHATGRPSFPQGGVREQLTASRTYYVRTDGTDSNDGLTNASGGAFRTIQKALNVVYGELDIGIHAVTVQVGAGTYAENLSVTTALLGRGFCTLRGDPTTPANVVISGSSNCLTANNFATITIDGFKLVPGGSGRSALYTSGIGVIFFQNIDFGTASSGNGTHINCLGSGSIQASGNYEISGGAARHMMADRGGQATIAGRTITLSGTPAFSGAFAFATDASRILASGCTFSGAATGPRYSVAANGVIRTGGSASYLPGDAPGSASTGGQYL